jgi:uncharacterized protein (TIGR02466 family)
MNLNLEKFKLDYHFSSTVIRANIPEYLNTVKPVFDEYIKKSININEIRNPVYPGIMTEILSTDSRIESFVQYVSDLSWHILNHQGYNMDLYYTDASEMWGQYHPYSSNMEQHIHGNGIQLSGFYFLETPNNSSKLLIHDPRSTKVQIGLPERRSSDITPAHNMITYTPEPGDLIFTNSWLSHSFSRNSSHLPYSFIHINVRVVNRKSNELNSQSNIPQPIIV